MKKTYLLSIWAIAVLVGSYQLPLIENTLSKHQVLVNINDRVPYARDFQQNVEDQKIAFSAYLDNIGQKPETTVAQTPVQVVKVSAQGNESAPPDSTSTMPSGSTPAQPTVSGAAKTYCQENCKVLMMGDSVMGDVDFSLARLLKKEKPSWQVIDAHKVSSGLTNQTYYDWPKTADKLVSQYKPDYVVMLVGTNDAQGMMVDGHGYAFDKDSWRDAYRARMNHIMDNLKTHTQYWLWVELPVVRDSGFNSRLQAIRNIQKDAAGEHLLETESIFGNVDHSQPINMKLRAGDGIHLSSSGANLVADHINNQFKKILDSNLASNQ